MFFLQISDYVFQCSNNFRPAYRVVSKCRTHSLVEFGDKVEAGWGFWGLEMGTVLHTRITRDFDKPNDNPSQTVDSLIWKFRF